MVPHIVLTTLLLAGSPERVDNPRSAPHRATIAMEEMWRVGGLSEEPDELFGVILDVGVDSEGSVYLLDMQLAEVKVFDREGRFVRRIGRSGEGPGEFTRPYSLCFLDDGRLCVMQPAPARLSLFTPDGGYAGKLPLAADIEAGFQYLSRIRSRGAGIVVEGLTVTSGEGYMDQTSRISRIDGDGTTVDYASASRRIEFARPVVRERETRMLQWTLGREGRVYVTSGFDFEISVFGRDGSLQRVIARDYEHRKRSDAEMEAMRAYFVRGGGTQGSTIEIMPYDRDVQWFELDDGGRLWVLGSHGANHLPPDTIGVFDVFEGGRLTIELRLE
ncbi:MAG: 6-bladed beta-propeller, partial [Acidobacteriota bacterium]|nr:6-bladed beta-propeller [Acidobacteriota bacterium]